MKSRRIAVAPGQIPLGLIDDGAAIRELIVSSLVRGNDSRVVRELSLRQGTVRADLAVISDRIHGYEIKSARDDMRRLPGQAELYGEVFDTVTVVTVPRHLTAVGEVVPDWWGIAVADVAAQTVETDRPPGSNPTPDPRALVRLLHHDETVLLIAERTGEEVKGTRPELWSRLLSLVEADELRAAVCRMLRQRQDWLIAY